MAHRQKKIAGARKKELIYPIILAAGKAPRLRLPQALAIFGGRTTLELAVENCTGLAAPIVVLGHNAARVRRKVPRDARVMVHRGWRAGQLSSLRAGLRSVPPDAAFLLYPVDYPLLTARVIRRLVAGYRRAGAGQAIVMPVFRGRRGHPVIFSAVVRAELLKARTAREVVDKEPGRVKCIAVDTPAISMDFDSPASYRACRRIFAQRKIQD